MWFILFIVLLLRIYSDDLDGVFLRVFSNENNY